MKVLNNEDFMDMWYELRGKIEEASFLSDGIMISKLLDEMDEILVYHVNNKKVE